MLCPNLVSGTEWALSKLHLILFYSKLDIMYICLLETSMIQVSRIFYDFLQSLLNPTQ